MKREGRLMAINFRTLRCSGGLYSAKDTYNKYRELCKKKGLLVSRQVEIMMEEQLEGAKNDKKSFQRITKYHR